MNKISVVKILLFGGLLFWSTTLVYGQSSLNPSFQNFTWYTNNHFKLSEENGSFKIEMDKMPWEAFTLYLNGVDLSDLPVLEIKVKSDAKIDLRVDMIDESGENSIITPIIKTINAKGSFVELSFDFSDIQEELDATKISHLHFYVAPGERHQGVIEIKDILFQSLKQKELDQKNQIDIASNLNRKEITIHSQFEQFDQIKIYNNLGHLVFFQKIPLTNSKTLNIDDLEQGIFFLEIKKQDDVFYIGSISR